MASVAAAGIGSVRPGKLAGRTALAARMGTLEPTLSARLMRLMKRGNSYDPR
jgi:hypothetical protein